MANCLILHIMSTTLTTNNIDNKPQDMTICHCIHLNNHSLPYTTKCKYLGHIINNNLTDDDDIARQKRCLYAQANVLARKCCLCNISTKITLFQAYCAPANSKNIASKALPSHTIITSEFYSTYPLDVVQVLCLPPTTLHLLMNAFVHPYLVFYVVFISGIIFFLLITSIPTFILRAVCTLTGGHYYTHNICIVFLLIKFV